MILQPELVQWSASNVYLITSCLRTLQGHVQAVLPVPAAGTVQVVFDSAEQKFATELASCCDP
jgi:hypothetical protein